MDSVNLGAPRDQRLPRLEGDSLLVSPKGLAAMRKAMIEHQDAPAFDRTMAVLKAVGFPEDELRAGIARFMGHLRVEIVDQP